MNLTIQPTALGGSSLSRAYVENYQRIARFYLAGPPDDTSSYERVAQAIHEGWSSARSAQLAEQLRRQGTAAGNPPELQEGRALFVATGQQPGLFVSPLLTLYKALTAARLAEQLREHLAEPVWPLFSVASEDHDWAEVDHTYVIDVENRLTRLQIGGPSAEGDSPPVEAVRLGDDIGTAVQRLADAIPDTEFKEDVLRPLVASYRVGRPVAQAFQETLVSLLERHRFSVVRSAEPWIKQRSKEVLWAEYSRRRESESALLARAAELEASGFQVQVPVTAGTTNLFFTGSLGRDRILHDEEGPYLRRSGERISENELRDFLERTPERVSPGALFRPVTEATALPVVAYVGGPSEIAYLAESQVLFALHGVSAPVVVPRAAFRLVEPKIQRVLEKYGVSADDLDGDPSQVIGRVTSGLVPEELQGSIADLRRTVGGALDRVESAVLKFDGGARSLIGSGKRAVFGSIDQLESKLQARVREKNQVAVEQLEKALVNLYPNGRPQERVLNPFPYLARYGTGLLDAIYERVLTPLG